MARYRVLEGLHSEGGKIYGPKRAAENLDRPELYAGEVIETDKDLEALNMPGFPKKFERIDDEPADSEPVRESRKRSRSTVAE